MCLHAGRRRFLRRPTIAAQPPYGAQVAPQHYPILHTGKVASVYQNCCADSMSIFSGSSVKFYRYLVPKQNGIQCKNFAVGMLKNNGLSVKSKRNIQYFSA